MSNGAAARPRSGMERLLGLFTEVRAGEGMTALLMTFNIFLILTSYYIIKPVREALILAGGGAELKSYLSAGQAVLLIGVAVPFYGWLAGRLPRRPLINAVTLFFAGCLVLFYFLARLGVPLGVVFFLWVGIFNLMVPAQFWAFANDVYSVEEGKRLFAIVAFGASAGAVLGSVITGWLIAPLGLYQLMLVAAGLLVLSLLITNHVDGRERHRRSAGSATGAEDQPVGRKGALAVLFANRYLLLIAVLMLLLNWVNTTGEYILGKTVSAAARDAVAAGIAGGLDEREFIGKFYSDFFGVVNVAGLLIQLFLVSRIIKYAGVRAALAVLPVIALGSYALLAFVPILGVIRWAKTVENATDYSLQNTVRQALFLPTTREEKYTAKQAIDTFFVRAGDVLSAGVVFAGTAWLSFGTREFAMVNMGLAAAWFLVALGIGHRYAALAGDSGERRRSRQEQ